MKNLHSIGTATVDESFFHPNHDSLTGRGECTCRVGSSSKSKDDRGNEFHGSEGLFLLWLFVGVVGVGYLWVIPLSTQGW